MDLAKRVSADTITGITGSARFNATGDKAAPPPSVEDLADKIRTRLKKQTFAAQAVLDAADPENERQIAPREAALKQAQENEKTFEYILDNVPDGFKLVPVFYDRITMEENNAIKEEYSYKVRPRFLKFLGENYAEDLKALGVPAEGIERMKGGLDPVDARGNLFNLNVDHIVERAGSGKMGTTRSADPDLPGLAATFEVNHIGNFILLPEKVHEFKNMLNDLLEASDMPYKKGKWILMMAPERNELHHGFVAQPQKKGHPLEGVGTHPLTFRHNQFLAEITTSQFAELKDIGNMRTLVRSLLTEAQKQKTTVAALAETETRSKKPGIRKAFNDAVAKEPKAAELVDGLLRPGLRDFTQGMAEHFKRISQKTETYNQKQAVWEFARFLRSQMVKDLRADAEALPVPESAEMSRVFNQLTRDVNAICDRLDAEGKARRATASNDNTGDQKPPSKKPQQGKKPYRKKQDPGALDIKKPGKRF